jgi:outer membrane protein TolC
MALALMLGLIARVPARADEPALALAVLEQRVSSALALQAAQQHADSAAQAAAVESARSGLQYFLATGYGFHNSIVTNNLNNQALDYDQRIGVQLPLLGTNFDQTQSILSAQTAATLARISVDDTKRQVVAQLRDAYVQYWLYSSQSTSDVGYVGALNQELPRALALVKTGFWTGADLIDFREALSAAQTDLQVNRNSRRAQLSRLRSVLGQRLDAFSPLEPDFAAACEPSLDRAIDLATNVDATIAKLEAQIAETKTLLKNVPGSSIQASAQTSFGAVFNIPPRAGYEFVVGLNASLPAHNRVEEQSRRREYEEQLADLRLQEQQARLDVASAVELALTNYTNARVTLAQAREDERARREDLRTSLVRFQTINAPDAAPFAAVNTATINVYKSVAASTTASANVYLAANQLLLLSPGACQGGSSK